MAKGLHLKSHVSRDGVFQDTWPGKNEFYIEKGGEAEAKSSFCHVVLKLARGARQSGARELGIRERTAQRWRGGLTRRQGGHSGS